MSALAEISAASMPAGFAALRNFASPRSITSLGVFAGLGQRALAVNARLDVGAAQLGIDRLLDIVGQAFLDDQHVALADAEGFQLVGDQRIGEVEAIDRDARVAEIVGEAEPRERAQHACCTARRAR